MTIQCNEQQQWIALQGHCTVEESEELLQLVDELNWPVEVSELSHLHTACLQVLMLRNVEVIGKAKSNTLNQFIANTLCVAA